MIEFLYNGYRIKKKTKYQKGGWFIPIFYTLSLQLNTQSMLCNTCHLRPLNF